MVLLWCKNIRRQQQQQEQQQQQQQRVRHMTVVAVQETHAMLESVK
jgi:hypothetical protein